MPDLEFLERLPASNEEERWLVRVAGSDAVCVAWLFTDPDRSWLEAVERDSATWVGFGHPRVSKLLATRWIDDRLLCAIEDDRGPSLATAAAQLADTPVDRERWVVAQIIAIADGLTAMARHVPGFIHRRLEPHRLFVGISGQARLRAPVSSTSVGASRSYMGAGRITGTARWMSPEQGRGLSLTPASDVFSLAGNLAYAITGRPPFAAETELASLMAIVHGPPPVIATATAGLDQVFARAFANDPAARYSEVAAFADALRTCVPDAAEYDACLSDRIAAWWPAAPPAQRGVDPDAGDLLGDRCQMAWDQLIPTADEDLRACGGCGQTVVRVRSVEAVLPLVGRRCVYVPRG